MKYTIISIDDSREAYKKKIRSTIQSLEEVSIECVDGRYRGAIERYLEENPWLKVNTDLLKRGEIGVWLSVINVLHQVDDLLITIEDDAVLHPEFDSKIHEVEFPEDMDFFALFVPRDHSDWFYYNKAIEDDGRIIDPKFIYCPEGGTDYLTDNPAIVRPYQRYGGVSMVYTPQGAKNILGLLETYGIVDQYDNFLFQMTRTGELKGYTHNPEWPDLVSIVGGPTLTHETELFICKS